MLCNVEDIDNCKLMFEISAKKDLCDVIWGSEVKTSD